MPTKLDAPAVAVRLRRLWLGPVLASPELAHSDLHDAALSVVLTRVGGDLVVSTPYDFGTGDPFAGPLGDLLVERVTTVSGGAVRTVSWRYDLQPRLPRRSATSDLDVFAPGDPPLTDYAGVREELRRRVVAEASPDALAVVGALRLVGVSRHRLWFAASDAAVLADLGRVPGARAALHVACAGLQQHEQPLMRVVVDASYRAARDRLVPP